MRGRFAPSPTGPLHAGSMVAALASWLDVRAAGGQWLVRIEDVDGPRCKPGVDRLILAQLAACGLIPDEPPVWQSQRSDLYQAALDQLRLQGLAYPCGCTRKTLWLALQAAGREPSRHGEWVYPGTCRGRAVAEDGPVAWRLRTVDGAGQAAGEAVCIDWHDRRWGPRQQNLSRDVGDFVLKRSDGLWAYQLAVVVDDAAQGITDVVRGQDLVDNTPRQIWLQRCLGLPTPRYAHLPLVLGPDGDKLSKQNGAQAVDVSAPLVVLQAAARHLGLVVPPAATVGAWLAQAVSVWRDGMMRDLF
ncbi:tRNA glutamyl-Q(34) synthetase GluQRS [Leptothrix ochracea]|uniref:tRNA glutamyl-Q(34) synthetase GluQRS n=1 Tax=Leptothrix ochracea TaxID=735331 RepID=UPI0034E1F32B